MRTAVSNIAWTADEDDDVLALLAARGVDAVEVAPTRLWPEPELVSDREARLVAQRFADVGLPVVAFQSLLFGVADVDLFGDEEARTRVADRLLTVIRLAAAMGAGPLVYGSPATRRPPLGMSAEEALDVATRFFRPLARVAADAGVVLCIEPNPPQYGCAFVTDADGGAELVHAVDSRGMGLHLDAAAMAMVGDDGPGSVRRHAGVLRHFHASAPQLAALEQEVVDHAALADALREVGYAGTVSVEMRAAGEGDRARVTAALDVLDATYRRGAEAAA